MNTGNHYWHKKKKRARIILLVSSFQCPFYYVLRTTISIHFFFCLGASRHDPQLLSLSLISGVKLFLRHPSRQLAKRPPCWLEQSGQSFDASRWSCGVVGVAVVNRRRSSIAHPSADSQVGFYSFFFFHFPFHSDRVNLPSSSSITLYLYLSGKLWL